MLVSCSVKASNDRQLTQIHYHICRKNAANLAVFAFCMPLAWLGVHGHVCLAMREIYIGVAREGIDRKWLSANAKIDAGNAWAPM